MAKSILNIFLFVALVSVIYVLRDSQSSPSGFLRNQVSRILDTNTNLQSLLCSNVDMSAGTDSDTASYQRIGSFINTVRGGNKIDSFISGSSNSTQFSSEYGLPLIYFTIPYIVIFVIAIVGTMWCMINFCCMFCCKNGKTCKVPNEIQPLRAVSVSTIVLLLLVLGGSIAGIVYTTRVANGTGSTLCAAGIFIDKALSGPSTTDQKWMGVSNMVSNLIVALTEYQSVSSVIVPPAQATTLANALIVPDSAAKLYKNHMGDTITPRADPAIGGTYVLNYVQNLGDTTKNNTYMGRIFYEQQEKKNRVVNASLEITLAATAWTANIAGSLVWMNYVKDLAMNVSLTLSNVTANITSVGANGGTAVNGLRITLIVIFSLVLSFSIFAILFMVLYRSGVKVFGKFLDVAWFFLVFLMILSTLLVIVLVPTSVGLIESCQTFEAALTNPTAFNATFKKFVDGNESDIKRNVAYTCLFGNGDTMQAAGMRGKLNFVDNMFSALDRVANLTESVGPVTDSIEIPAQIAYLNSLLAGTVVDSDATATDLATLNKLTSSTSNTCTTVKDVWTTGSSVCTTANGANFTSTSDAAFNVGSNTCIGLDVFASKTISKRYNTTSFPATCPATGGKPMADYVQAFVTNLETAKTNLKTQINSILTDFGTTEILLGPGVQVAKYNNLFMNNVKAVTMQFDRIRTQTKPVYNALGSATTGVFRNSNCSFILTHSKNIHDQMCHKLAPSLFATTLIILIISVIGLFGVLTLFLSIKRFAAEEKAIQAHTTAAPYKVNNNLNEPLNLAQINRLKI